MGQWLTHRSLLPVLNVKYDKSFPNGLFFLILLTKQGEGIFEFDFPKKWKLPFVVEISNVKHPPMHKRYRTRPRCNGGNPQVLARFRAKTRGGGGVADIPAKNFPVVLTHRMQGNFSSPTLGSSNHPRCNLPVSLTFSVSVRRRFQRQLRRHG